jgi:putative hydrolase of the HAD superfamily
MIKLYVFDQGGVICRSFDIGPEAAARLGICLEEWRRLALPDIQAFMRGDLDAAVYWRRFEERSGLRVGEDYWETLFRPTLDAPTFALARELGESGRVVCGTNTIAAHYEIHRGLGQYDCFHRVYASHLLRRAKPEAGFYASILESEGVRPDEAFFTDDYPENVEAAAALGIHARLYSDADALRRDLAALGAPVRGALAAEAG